MSKLTQLGAVLALVAFDASTPPLQTTLPAGPATWTLTGDPSIAALTPSADGLSATLVGVSAAGSVTVTATLGGFTKSDTFDFDGAVIAPPAPPTPGPAASIDWTVTPITADPSAPAAS